MTRIRSRQSRCDWTVLRQKERKKAVGKSGYGDRGDGSRSFRVTVRDEKIIITWPRTWFTVVYRRLSGPPYLIATNVVEDVKFALKKAYFLDRAFRIASNKARELGWFV